MSENLEQNLNDNVGEQGLEKNLNENFSQSARENLSKNDFLLVVLFATLL